MKRLIIGACLVATACQTSETTSAVEQAASECHPGGNYWGAKLPALGLWNYQSPPTAGPGQLYMDHADPYVQGRHYAFVVDPTQGTIVWSGACANATALPLA